MSIELKVPEVGESITEVELGQWLKSVGDSVTVDEPVVVIETDKVTVELLAPVAGTVSQIIKREGDSANVGEVVGLMTEGMADAGDGTGVQSDDASTSASVQKTVMPAAARAAATAGVDPQQIDGSGPGGRVLKEDVQRAVSDTPSQSATAPAPPPSTPDMGVAGTAIASARQEEVVPLTPLRRKVASRLVSAQQTAALLTTFNEADMSAVMELRKSYKDDFQKRYDIKLGFMSFFAKAVIEALKLVPQLNAEIRDDSIVYRNYHDLGVAVGGKRGLVVPVIRNAEGLSFAEIERTISDFGRRARDNTLKLEELTGGTFTISNGGVYGSLLSTPIVNPPQSGILGLHAINERPVARDGQVVIRPMMYLALTYDHRIVDGKEAVTFLKRIAECIENPARMLLEV